jgi:hypothetical protein
MWGRRRLWAAYLVGQAIAVVVWWVALVASGQVRGWFELDGGRRDVLNAYVLGDVVVLAVGSTVAATALLRSVRSAPLWTAWVAGGCAYSTLYLAAWVAFGGVGAIGLVPMAIATGATSAIAVAAARA